MFDSVPWIKLRDQGLGHEVKAWPLVHYVINNQAVKLVTHIHLVLCFVSFHFVLFFEIGFTV